MKAFNCFVVICAGLLVSSDFAFGLSFGVLQLRAERKVDNEAAPSDDVFVPVTDDLLKKVERRIAKMQESAIREINNQGSPESLLDNLQNKTTKQLKKPDNIYTKEDTIPLEVPNGLDQTESKSNSEIDSSEPKDSQGSPSQGKAVITSYWQPVARDLSKDTLINDRITQQQSSAGIVNIDPDAEFIDPKKHKGHIAQDSRMNLKYDRRPLPAGADRDVEEIESENYNSLDQTPASDLTRDTFVNEHMARKLASGSIKADSDAEFIDPKQHQGHIAQRTTINLKPNEPSGILSRFGDSDRDTEEIATDNSNSLDQSSAGADLGRDILVNEHAASQVASGLITTDPDAEFISVDGIAKTNKNYYYVPDTVQQVPVVDLIRDNSFNMESFSQPQVPPGVVMIEPNSGYTNSRRYRRPSQNPYYRSADRYERTPQADLGRDIAINDHLTQQQTASGLVMIDPDAELINARANQQNNVYYYYVPNNIDQVPRMKRTQPTKPVYHFYQRPAPIVGYPYPQQPIMYY